MDFLRAPTNCGSLLNTEYIFFLSSFLLCYCYLSDIYSVVKNGGREKGEQKGKGKENRRGGEQKEQDG